MLLGPASWERCYECGGEIILFKGLFAGEKGGRKDSLRFIVEERKLRQGFFIDKDLGIASGGNQRYHEKRALLRSYLFA